MLPVAGHLWLTPNKSAAGRIDAQLSFGCAGDSLLFAAGAFAALGSLNVWALFAVFITAAILGDALNYAIGNYAGVNLVLRFSDEVVPAEVSFCHD